MNRILSILLAVVLVLGLFGCATASRNPQKVRIMTYNIHHGVGADGKLDLQRIADLIRSERIDIVGLQEIDRGVERSEKRDVIAELSRLTGMQFYFAKNITYQGGDYGNAVLTRFPVLEQTNTHFKMLHPGEQRGVIQMILNVNGTRLAFLNTHIDYRDDDVERRMNIRELKEIVARLGEKAVVMCGDFNATPDSRVHTELDQFMDDAWEKVGEGTGLTLYSDRPEKRIDYIWISPKRVKPISVAVPQTQASDHLPVVGEFEIR